MGYHTSHIEKGELGEFSKIKEEFLELQDAVDQGVKGLIVCELSDLYGAMEEYVKRFNMTMEDVRAFSDLTKSAFADGERTAPDDRPHCECVYSWSGKMKCDGDCHPEHKKKRKCCGRCDGINDICAGDSTADN